MSCTENDFVLKDNHNSGGIRLTLSCCEIDGVKTVHFDAFSEDDPPYGHIRAEGIKSMIAWLKDAEKWVTR